MLIGQSIETVSCREYVTVSDTMSARPCCIYVPTDVTQLFGKNSLVHDKN